MTEQYSSRPSAGYASCAERNADEIIWPSSRLIGRRGRMHKEVQIIAHGYYVEEHWPDGRNTIHWGLAIHKFRSDMAHGMWEHENRPDGRDGHHWWRAGVMMAIGFRADVLFLHYGCREDMRKRAWDEATREIVGP